MTDSKSTTGPLAIEGCNVRVVVDGDETRPALVLSHMLGTDLSLWDDLVPALASRFRVIRLDARGHGGSDLGRAPVTIARLGLDVVAVLDALGVERAHVLGLSMGGAVGLWLLAHAPSRVERAVIAGSAAKLGDATTWNARIAAALDGGMEPAVEPTIERWFSPAYLEAEPDRVDRIRALVRATPAAGFAACCAALRDMDLREVVRGAPHPVLVIRGADDPSATAQDAEDLLSVLDNASVIELPARHCLAVEVEGAFLDAAVRFLTTKAPPRRASARRTPTKSRKAAPRDARPVPATRRSAGRGPGDARRPVAKTVPASGKAIATASASRKTGARVTTRPAEVASRRRGVVESTGRPASGTKRSSPSGRLSAAVAKRATVAKSVGSSGRGKAAAAQTAAKPTARRPAATARSSSTGAKTVTAAALRAAVRGTASTRGKATASRAKAARIAIGKTSVGKTAAAKLPAAKPAAAKPAPPKPAAPKSVAPKSVAGKRPSAGTALPRTAGRTSSARSAAAKPAANVRADTARTKSKAKPNAKTGQTKTGQTKTGQVGKSAAKSLAPKTGATKSLAPKTGATKSLAAKTGAAKAGVAKPGVAKAGVAKSHGRKPATPPARGRKAR